MKKQLADGFTLIELMIVIVIVSILASIAYPAYVDQVRKGRRADCAGVLTGLAAAMERKFTENNNYLALAGTDATPADSGTPRPSIYSGKCPISPPGTTYYNLTIDNITTATTFEISATPVGDQAKDTACGTLTLTNTGIKRKSGTAPINRCW